MAMTEEIHSRIESRTVRFVALLTVALLTVVWIAPSLSAQGATRERSPSGATAQSSLPTEYAATSGFRSLFDGATLTGWVTEGGRYDGAASWSVEDGVITGREGPNQAGGLLYTAEQFGNFVFRCEAQIVEPFDSGIFLRMLPTVSGLKGPQITLDARPSGEIGAIYADGYLAHSLLEHNRVSAESSLRHDDWNQFVVVCIGHPFRLQVWMNGETLADYTLPPELADQFAARGRIGLQVHGARDDPARCNVRFRALMIRELPEFDPSEFDCTPSGRLLPVASGPVDPWRPMFDVSDSASWRPADSAVDDAADDGAIVFAPTAHAVRAVDDLRGAFEMRFDVRGSPNDSLSIGWSPPDSVPHVAGVFTSSLLSPQPAGAWFSCFVRRSADGAIEMRVGDQRVSLAAPVPLSTVLTCTLALLRGPDAGAAATNSGGGEPLALRNAYWRPIAATATGSR